MIGRRGLLGFMGVALATPVILRAPSLGKLIVPARLRYSDTIYNNAWLREQMGVSAFRAANRLLEYGRSPAMLSLDLIRQLNALDEIQRVHGAAAFVRSRRQSWQAEFRGVPVVVHG